MSRKLYPERVKIIEGIKHYGKLEGTRLAMKYLPESTPFTDVTLVVSVEEWEQIKDQYSEKVVCRVDAPIGQARELQQINTSGLASDIPQTLRRIQAVCPEAAVLVMKTKQEPVNRLQYDGGFNIFFQYGREMLIELVGPGFDGHELTYGLAMHESWRVPWEGMMDMKRWRGQAGYAHSTVDPGLYIAQREARFILLTGECKMDAAEVAAALPEIYEPLIGKMMLTALMDKIVVPLMQATNPQTLQDWSCFCVQGNIVKGEPEAWEIFLPQRWS